MKWILVCAVALTLGQNYHSVVINDYEASEKCDINSHIATYHFLGSIKDLNLDIEKEQLHTSLTIHVDPQGRVSKVDAKGGASYSLSFVAAQKLQRAFFEQRGCYIKLQWQYKKRW